MNVVFYYMNDVLAPYLDTCIRSIRQHIPNSHVVHLTDQDTPPCPAADEVRRFTSPYPTRPVNFHTINFAGYYCLAECGIPEMLYTEPDMLYAGDIGEIFHGDFDVTLADRPDKDRVTPAYRRLYPYNSMMFVRSPRFFPDCYQRMRRFRSQNWARNMEAVGNIVHGGKYRVRILDGDIYNARPRRFNPKVKVYHFRVGERKNTYMPEFYHKYIEGH